MIERQCVSGYAVPILVFSVLLVFCSDVPSAQSEKFQAERERADRVATDLRARKGLKVTGDTLASPFEKQVTIQKVRPGGSVLLAVPGDFPEGTTILSERDGAVLSGATLSASSFTARLTVGPNEGPGFVRLWGLTPTGFDTDALFTAVAFIDTLYRFELKSPSGYTVKVTPAVKSFTVTDEMNAQAKYQAAFYKPGDTTPFETMIGEQNFTILDRAQSRLDIALTHSTTSPQAEIEDISNRLADPKLTPAQRTALMAKMGEAQQRALATLTKGLQTDPTGANKETDDFGCRLLQVYPGQAGAAEGTILCGDNFNGGMLKTTGTMTIVR